MIVIVIQKYFRVLELCFSAGLLQNSHNDSYNSDHLCPFTFCQSAVAECTNHVDNYSVCAHMSVFAWWIEMSLCPHLCNCTVVQYNSVSLFGSVFIDMCFPSL